MSGELSDLYRELILDHKRHPRNFHAMPDATRSRQGHNPLCGDELVLHLKLDGDRIADISFQGRGCAISMASASLLTEQLKGKSVHEAEQLFERMHALLTGDGAEPQTATLGKLAVLSGVRDFPSRVKCATLPWHTLISALAGDEQTVSTE